MHPLQHHPGKSRQRGVALMVMLVILVMGTIAFLANSLNSSTLQTARNQVSADTLSKAKEALIGNTISQPSLTSAGKLHLPDLGFKIGAVPSEGSSAPNFSGNSMNFSVIGKVPWKTLGIPPSRDGQGECTWYAVSGHFKDTPTTLTTPNWDTLGQIDIIDGNGNAIASNVVALLVAPGPSIDGQSRILSDPAYTQCGGNYDARNYLDSYNGSDAIAGEVNYFTGSTNNRIAPNANNKRFVMADNSHYNDHFLLVTTDDIFRPLMRRSDFSAQISVLMNDTAFITHLQGIAILGTKGTGNVNCNNTNTADNKTFCTNWLEMLLLTQLSTPSAITIDGVPTATCNRVLIFGGQKTSSQIRLTATDKANPANYLETPNSVAFAVPITSSNNFTGTSTFNANNPSTDLLKCIP